MLSGKYVFYGTKFLPELNKQTLHDLPHHSWLQMQNNSIKQIYISSKPNELNNIEQNKNGAYK